MSFGEDITELVAASTSDLHAAASWWKRVPLGQVVRVVNGYPFDSKFFSDTEGERLIRIRDVTSGDTSTRYRGPVPDGFWVERDEIIVGMDGDFTLRVWAAAPGLLNQRVCKLTPNPQLIDPGFLGAVLPGYLKLINDHTPSVTVKHLSSRTLQQVPIPLPPLAEQRRIVARIQALFARTRRARADLERVEPLAASYRRHRLRRSFDDAAGYDSPQLGTLLQAIEAGKNLQCEERRPQPGERGIVKISAVTWGRFDADKIKTAPEHADLDPRSRIANGDFLLSRANTLELVGAPVIAEGVPPDTYLSDKVLRLRFREPIDRWAMWFLRSPAGRAEIESRSSGNQLSMRNIGQGALREIPIPIPPAETRAAILSEIEVGHQQMGEGDAAASRALALLDRLEQSILTKAFRGELVPQDPSDEPAEALLARLRTDTALPTRARRGRPAAIPAAIARVTPPASGSKAPPPAALVPAASATSAPQATSAAAAPHPEPDESEIACAIRALFADAIARPRDQALRDLAHALGHRRLGARIEARMHGALIMAVRRRILENTPDGLRLLTRAIGDYTREELQTQFLAALQGRAWTDQDDATHAFARWLGFQRTGPVITETATATIRTLIRQGRLERDGTSIRRCG